MSAVLRYSSTDATPASSFMVPPGSETRGQATLSSSPSPIPHHFPWEEQFVPLHLLLRGDLGPPSRIHLPYDIYTCKNLLLHAVSRLTFESSHLYDTDLLTPFFSSFACHPSLQPFDSVKRRCCLAGLTNLTILPHCSPVLPLSLNLDLWPPRIPGNYQALLCPSLALH